MKTLSRSELELIREVILRESSICTKQVADSSIEANLVSLARRENRSSLHELVDGLRSSDSLITSRVIDLFTIHETSFFRDKVAIDIAVGEILPELMNNADRSVTIWSAGCSTGQELYSLAISILESGIILTSNVKLVGSDVSEAVIEKANSGLFSELELKRGIKESIKNRYFTKQGDYWRVNDEIRDHVRFNVSNINGVGEAYPIIADIVFLRNTLIYFTDEAKLSAANKMRNAVTNNAVVFLGSSESALPDACKFTRVSSKLCHYYRAN